MSKKWQVNKKFPKKFKEQFPKYSEIICQLLYEREIKTQQEVDEFFNPDYEKDLHDPFLMKDMDKATKRIFEALDKKEKITVYGDYDVDGVTSSILIISALEEIKKYKNICGKDAKSCVSTNVYLPDREKEGYGLNGEALEKIAKNGTKLIITVDCGISSYENVEKAKKLGMEVVVTDHHSVPKKIPRATALVNPKQKDCAYPFKELAGVGVAFKLAQALYQKLSAEKPTPNPSPQEDGARQEGNKKPLSREGLGCVGINPNQKTVSEIKITSEKWLLDLVALGTVADCVDLVGENRTLVKYGLLVLEKTRRIGLKALIENSVSGNKSNSPLKKGKGCVNKNNFTNASLTHPNPSLEGNIFKKRIKIDTYAIGYILAPRLNAAGRIDHANTAYHLLTAESEKEAEILIAKLEANNRERQKITTKIISEVEERIDKKYSRENLPKVILESGQKWKIGVAGLAAGKLANKFSRPTIILCQKKDSSAGSGRSIPQFNLIDAISACRDLLIEFGGHSQAAGLKIENNNLEKFYREIKKIADRQLSEDDLIPEILISQEISPQDIDWNLYNQIAEFQPFGMKNKKPLFLARGLEVANIRGVGTNGSKKYNKHLQLNLKHSNNQIKHFKAICFNQGEMIEKIKIGDLVDIVFSLEVNEWNGNRELQLNVTDLKLSGE